MKPSHLLACAGLLGCASHPPPVEPALCPGSAVPDAHNFVLLHDNEMGYPMTLRELRLQLDGEPVQSWGAGQVPPCSRNLVVHSTRVGEGDHVAVLHLRFDTPGVVAADVDHGRQDVRVDARYAFTTDREQRVWVRAVARLRDFPERARVPVLDFLEVAAPSVARGGTRRPSPAE